jgi:steroid delta-isomerase-like uncharacterized protein
MLQPRLLLAAASTTLLLLCANSAPADSARAKAPATLAAKQEQNKATARRVYEEGLSQGIFEVPYTRDFIGHGGGVATFTHEQGMAEARGWRKAFPDLKVVVDLIVAEGDLVSVRWTARGTNTGSGNGIPATGKSVQTTGITMFRFVDGAIAEEWTAGNQLGLMRQLGLLPAPAASTEQKGSK